MRCCNGISPKGWTASLQPLEPGHNALPRTEDSPMVNNGPAGGSRVNWNAGPAVEKGGAMSSSVQARNRFERMSKPKRVFSILVALAVVIIALMAAAEGAVRLRQWIRYGSVQDVFYVYRVDPKLGTWFPKPNLDIVLARRSHITIDSAGFRSPEIQLTPPTPHTIRLAFLGGSTTFCAEASRNETTWPYLVAEKMQQHYPKVKIEFINAAARDR